LQKLHLLVKVGVNPGVDVVVVVHKNFKTKGFAKGSAKLV